MTTFTGVVIAAHGRHYLVQAGEEKLQSVTRGKKTDVAVGDLVSLQRTSANQAVIEAIQERKTLLYRSDQYKSKLLAANLSQLFIVVATEPAFADDLISRALVAAEAAGIIPKRGKLKVTFELVIGGAPLDKVFAREAAAEKYAEAFTTKYPGKVVDVRTTLGKERKSRWYNGKKIELLDSYVEVPGQPDLRRNRGRGRGRGRGR